MPETITITLDKPRQLRFTYEQLVWLSKPASLGGGGIDDPGKLLGEMTRTDVSDLGEGKALETIAVGKAVTVACGTDSIGVAIANDLRQLGVPIALNDAAPGDLVRYATINIFVRNAWAIETCAWAAMRDEDPGLTREAVARIIGEAIAAGVITLGDLGVAVSEAVKVGGLGSATRKNADAVPVTQ